MTAPIPPGRSLRAKLEHPLVPRFEPFVAAVLQPGQRSLRPVACPLTNVVRRVKKSAPRRVGAIFADADASPRFGVGRDAGARAASVIFAARCLPRVLLPTRR